MSDSSAAEAAQSDAAAESPATDGCEVIERPNKLRIKVGTGGGISPGSLDKARKVIEEEKTSFLKRLGGQLNRIEITYEGMHESQSFDLQRLWNLVHDLRSEAGTFGYPMLTEIGGSLCDLLQKFEHPGQREQQAIATHISAMRTIVNKRVEGDDDEITNQVATALREMVAGYV